MSWTSLRGITWGDLFRERLEHDFPAARGSAATVWMRNMSEILAIPMTALYALEFLNDNLDWTRKEVMGADAKTLYNASCWENILHMLPAVKIVKLVICGTRIPPLAD
ncbi:hypothetical protein C8J57DRAFT_1508539 [Mycena rebaudengoi]|nr:hypothetical protein C8J57DRAFT_1508539 [Mycena rebaudengoi]